MASPRKQKPRSLNEAYQDTFESAAGKAVLDDLEKKAFFTRTTFDPNPQQTAFNEGLRALVLHIHHYMNSKPIEEDGTDDDTES